MDYIAVLLPSVVVGLLFWFAMKAIFNADKSERRAEARAQAEVAARGPEQHPVPENGHFPEQR
jgi:hypothetical protein